MATKKKKRPKPPDQKQGHFEGMEPPSIPEIDKAADAYREARDERMLMLEEEIACQQTLRELMKKNDLTTYTYDGWDVLIDGEPKVKVRKHKEPKPSENGDE